MRQVLVKTVPAATAVSSGIVISVTNVALLVQSGGLVGPTVPTVGVNVTAVPSGVDVSVITGAAVVATATVGICVSVAAAVGVSGASPPPQADKARVINAITVKSFLVIRSLLCSRGGFKRFIYLLPSPYLYLRTSSSVTWIFRAGRPRPVLRMFHASARAVRSASAAADIL